MSNEIPKPNDKEILASFLESQVQIIEFDKKESDHKDGLSKLRIAEEKDKEKDQERMLKLENEF